MIGEQLDEPGTSFIDQFTSAGAARQRCQLTRRGDLSNLDELRSRLRIVDNLLETCIALRRPHPASRRSTGHQPAGLTRDGATRTTVPVVRLVTHAEAMEAFDYCALIDFMEEQHRHPPALVDDSYVESPGGDAMLARTGFAPGHGLGVKLAAVFPGNVNRPTVHSTYVLFDPSTGAERAVIAGNALTWFKTACDSALGARLLAPDESRVLLMVGAGAMAPHLIRAHRAARPSIERIEIWNRTRGRACALAAELADLDALVVDDLPAAVGRADVISCATMTVEPVIRGAWLRTGTHVDLVGSFRPDMREADDELLVAALVHVDSRDTTLVKTGELAIPLAAGTITADDVRGDLFELVAGDVVGRSSDADITVFKNGGGGHLDLMASQFLLGRLRG